MIHKAFKITIAFSFLLAGSAAHAGTEEDMKGEYLLKAAFLYNFAKFVNWPHHAFSDQRSSMILCILGEDPFGDALNTIKGKSVRGRKLVIKKSSRIEDLEKCHMLFVCSSERQRLAQVLERVKTTYVLTVGDMEDFAVQGGIVSFVKIGNKIKFEINMHAAQEAGLKISSKLLKLAKIVGSNRELEMK